jgi:hypothetical protein
MVRQILIRRSQLQPVTMAAAAGGKRMATCFRGVIVSQLMNVCIGVSAAHKDEEDVRSSERHYVQCSVVSVQGERKGGGDGGRVR